MENPSVKTCRAFPSSGGATAARLSQQPQAVPPVTEINTDMERHQSPSSAAITIPQSGKFDKLLIYLQCIQHQCNYKPAPNSSATASIQHYQSTWFTPLLVVWGPKLKYNPMAILIKTISYYHYYQSAFPYKHQHPMGDQTQALMLMRIQDDKMRMSASLLTQFAHIFDNRWRSNVLLIGYEKQYLTTCTAPKLYYRSTKAPGNLLLEIGMLPTHGSFICAISSSIKKLT